MKTLRISKSLLPHHLPRNRFRNQQQRTFLTPPIQNLAASRTLAYPAPAIYSIIADINSYSSFLPFLENSEITAWSRPDDTGKKWPSEALLSVGWKGFEESFTSKIYCVPGTIVEAVGGSTQTKLSREELSHYDLNDSNNSKASNENGILNHLLTRWTIRPFPFKPPPPGKGSPLGSTKETVPEDRTEVTLAIEYQFSNPMYSAMSGAVADKVAGVMIEAFEKRVKAVLNGKVEGSLEKGIGGVVHTGQTP